MNSFQFMFLSSLGFAVMGAFVKVAGSLEIPLLQIIAMRALISVFLSAASIFRARVNPFGTHRLLLLTRGIVGFLSLACVFYALLHLPFAVATFLQYLYPVFTTALAWIILKEVPDRATVVCVLLSLCGLVAILTPVIFDLHRIDVPTIAILAGLGGALGSGLAYTIVRKLASREHPDVIVLYFPLVCLPATVLIGASDFIYPDLGGWIALIGVGLFAQLGQIALTRAMARNKASRAVSLSYMQIVFAGVIGALYFDERLGLYTCIGIAFLLVGAGTVFFDRKEEPKISAAVWKDQ